MSNISIKVLESIAPSSESAQQDTLEYDNLVPGAARNVASIGVLSHNVWDAEAGSVEEEKAARLLAMQYLLMTAVRLNDVSREHSLSDDGTARVSTVDLAAKTTMWSDRYTRASSELYGVPDRDHARHLLAQQVSELLATPDITDEQRHFFQDMSVHFDLPTSVGEVGNDKEQKVLESLGTYLRGTYGDVLDCLTQGKRTYNAEDIANSFKNGLGMLVERVDPAWGAWEIELNPEKDQLSVVSSRKAIIVGAKRASVTESELLGLFGHEVLTHAQRALNGEEIDPLLGKGLAGYLDSEEGIATLIEHALSGAYPQKNIDRYIDVSLALGILDEEPKTRQWLIRFALMRSVVRNLQLDSGMRKTMDDITRITYTHVNRIYRGSPGNQFVGVFTKDIAYHNGYKQIVDYLAEQLETKSISEVIAFIMKGKFDPINKKHVDYVAALKHQTT